MESQSTAQSHYIWHACGLCRLFCTCQSLMFGQLWQKLGIKCNKKTWYLLTLSVVMITGITCMQCKHKHNIYKIFCTIFTLSLSLSLFVLLLFLNIHYVYRPNPRAVRSHVYINTTKFIKLSTKVMFCSTVFSVNVKHPWPLMTVW